MEAFSVKAKIPDHDQQSAAGTAAMSEKETPAALAEERTLLAAERTFSAWIRTGLAAMGGGLVVVRLVTVSSFAHELAVHVISALLILLGAAIFVFAFRSYHRTAQALERASNFSHSRTTLLAVTTVLVLIALLVLWITLT